MRCSVIYGDISVVSLHHPVNAWAGPQAHPEVFFFNTENFSPVQKVESGFLSISPFISLFLNLLGFKSWSLPVANRLRVVLSALYQGRDFYFYIFNVFLPSLIWVCL